MKKTALNQVTREAFERWGRQHDHSGELIAEIRERLISRLDGILVSPCLIADIGSGFGEGMRPLIKRFPNAHGMVVDWALSPMPQIPWYRWRLRSHWHRIVADARDLPLTTGAVDLIFSNMLLPWIDPPDLFFFEARRICRPGGLMLFSALGPDSFQELRDLWTQAGGENSIPPGLWDMHDLGDMLIHAGWSDPVLETERLIVHYTTWQSMINDFRHAGPLLWNGTMPHGRKPGQNLWRRFRQLLDEKAWDLTLEVIYAHSWALNHLPHNAGISTPGEFHIPLGGINKRKTLIE